MIDLKPYHDAVIASDAKLKEVANEIDVLFRLGTDEGKQKALAMQPALAEAQKNYDDSLSFYNSLKAASSPNDVAQLFVPASETPPDPENAALKGTMKLAEFQKMTPAERMKFSKAGGVLED